MKDLVVDHLAIQFGEATPVRDVCFRLDASQSLGVVGESGSGKSLTALAVMGLLPEQAQVSGELSWGGRSLLAMTEHERRSVRGREISMIFQDPMTCLNPSFTVGFQIEEVLKHRLGVRSRTERRRRGLETLSDVGIPAPETRWDAYPHQLSGGMSQRVAIAMALISEPELLIADEPTTALDVTVQMQILELLFSLKKKRGMSLLFVTHDLSVAGRLCDDILVMYAGQSMERAAARSILKTPQHPYTQALLGARPHLGASFSDRLKTIPGSVPRATEKIQGCVFSARCESKFERCALEAPAFSVDANVNAKLSRCFLDNSQRSLK